MQTIGDREPLHGELGRFYDAIENPRKTRGELPILRDAELRSYMADVRERTLEVLDEVEIGPDAEDPLLREGFVYEMLLAHEHQHNETMLQLLQMVDGYEPLRADRDAAPVARRRARRWSRSRRRATRSAPPHAASPTTTSAAATRSSWPPSRSTEPRSPTPRTSSSWRRPAPSRRCTGSATARAAGCSTAMGRREPVDPTTRSSTSPGRRPTPSPAGPASGCRPSSSGRRPAPRLDARRPGLGVDLLGLPRLPRLRGVPLPRVLRGLLRRRATRCCAAAPGRPTRDVVRPSFRNWDLPQRRQIFSGLRCARDADDRDRRPPRRRRRRRRWRATSAPASSASPKELSPKYFYDERGSQLFEQITELPEYYPTRARARDPRRALGRDRRRRRRARARWSSSAPARPRRPATCSSAMRDAGCLRTYVPVDISEEITHETAAALVEEYPGLDVRGLVCDFEHDLERIPTTAAAAADRLPRRHDRQPLPGRAPRVPDPDRRPARARATTSCSAPTWSRTPRRLEAAYDDSAGVTAEFNKNVLAVLNRELGADFDLDAFEHVARYDAGEERMDIRLRSLADQTVRLDEPRPDDRASPPARRCAPRSRPSSPASGSRASTPKPACELSGWFTDAAGDYALSLAARPSSSAAPAPRSVSPSCPAS